MNVGVIGTGFGRRVVAPVFDGTHGCTVVDVVSARDPAAVQAMVRRPELDLVAVHSPPFLHAPHVQAALEAGRAVLCDKPFALDPREAAALEGEAQAAGVLAFCNFEFRYAPARLRLRQMVADGTFGHIQRIQWTHISAGTRVPMRPFGWLFDRSLGGGWIGAWASHAVDTLRFVFGAEVEVVAAEHRLDIEHRPDRNGVLRECTAEDGLQAVLRLSTGAEVIFDSSFAAHSTTPHRIAIEGRRARAELVADARLHFAPVDGSPECIEITDGPHEPDAHLVPMRRWAEAIRDAVHTGALLPDAPTFTDGRVCDEVLLQLRVANRRS
jgi:predicted dehydrogenase